MFNNIFLFHLIQNTDQLIHLIYYNYYILVDKNSYYFYHNIQHRYNFYYYYRFLIKCFQNLIC